MTSNPDHNVLKALMMLGFANVVMIVMSFPLSKVTDDGD